MDADPDSLPGTLAQASGRTAGGPGGRPSGVVVTAPLPAAPHPLDCQAQHRCQQRLSPPINTAREIGGGDRTQEGSLEEDAHTWTRTEREADGRKGGVAGPRGRCTGGGQCGSRRGAGPGSSGPWGATEGGAQGRAQSDSEPRKRAAECQEPRAPRSCQEPRGGNRELHFPPSSREKSGARGRRPGRGFCRETAGFPSCGR